MLQSKLRIVPSGGAQQSRARPSLQMEAQGVLLVLLGTFLASAEGNPVAAASDSNNIPIQENFQEARFYGKWFGVAIGTSCPWMKQHKDRFNMGTMMVAPGKTNQEMSFTSTRLRQGLCSQVTGNYQKTGIPGKLSYYNPKWKAHIESYVSRTNYDEFAFIAMKKNSTHGLTTTAKLYGRNPEVREGLLAEFRQFALDLGIPEDAIFTLKNAGECVPPEASNGPQRVRRSALFEEEGSADGSLQGFPGNKEDDCLLPVDAGPCLGMNVRHFYNSSSQTCQTFFYGGCLGNDNNFASERACLQTCRTEAACRLPIIPGGACDTEFWAFDANQGKCVTFRGCGGNANKFYLEKECKEYCGVLPDADDEFLQMTSQ
ncbi:protein AMBP-like isoform X2 [Sceloporus undulatus]|uniref:protein AMBP-like isoform X2 n=1 Tax=Sceloporus undulatus TaxID=8520 RepID=UPI001C4B731F|nr:protein AMBP-like isoform X2 [Sceloporus undulatus]